LKKNNNLLLVVDTLSVKEIITIFSGIDDKICSLQQCSTNDFSIFNQQLKGYYKEVKTIIESSAKIKNIIEESQEDLIFTELNSFQNKLKIYLESSDKQLSFSIKSLSQLLKNISAIYLPLKNYKQNILTYKYLITNLKLNLTYLDKNNHNILDTECNQIFDLIQQIFASYNSIEKKLEQLKETTQKSLTSFKNLHEKNNINIAIIKDHIEYSINLLLDKKNDVKKQLIKQKQKTDECTDNVNKIITNLQFHDIIRQKIEHIQETYKVLINELQELDAASMKNIPAFKQMKYAVQIKDSSELQVAHLTHTNNKYQTALMMITKQFLEIGENMTNVSSMNYHIYINQENCTETYFAEIKKRVQISNTLFHEFNKNNTSITNETDFINKNIIEVTELHTIFKDLNYSLESLAFDALRKLDLSKYNRKDLQKITEHIKLIAADYINSLEIQQQFNKIGNLNYNLQSIFSEYSVKPNPTIALSQISDHATSLDKQLEEVDCELNKIVTTNKTTSNNIAVNIKETLQNIKYYDLFEKVIEEIIFDLNTINNKLSAELPDNTDNLKDHSLDNFKSLYTMQSERQIHDMVSGNETNNNTGSTTDETEEGDIELF